MTPRQIEWTAEQQKKLSDYISGNWPMNDSNWDSAVEFVDKTVETVASKDRKASEEVREKLFDVLEHYEKEAYEEKRKA